LDVSVVIPVYNEEQAVRGTVLEMKEALDKLDIKYEIIIVDDASTDNSVDKIRDLDVKIIRHKVNLCAGARINGMKYAEAPIILQTDADGTYPCDRIPEILQKMQCADMVIGARKYEAAKDFKLLRSIMKWFIKSFASYLSEKNIPDLNSGLRAYKKEAAMKYVPLYPQGQSIMSTMTLAFLMDKKDVEFVEIEYRKRIGKSKFRPIRDTYNYIISVFRTITYFSPFRIVTHLTIIFGLIALIFLVRDVFLYRNLSDTAVLMLIISVVVFLFGLLFDQISNIRKELYTEIAKLMHYHEGKSGKELIESDPNIEIIKE
jgi:glycosyltransferase involved in cell wall biosynthesis